MTSSNLSEEFINILEAIKSSGAQTVNAKEFVIKESNVIFLKHDIHTKIDNLLDIALYEYNNNINSTFFIMANHEFSKKYFKDKGFNKLLLEFIDKGHQIGLHFDLHDIILQRGEFDSEIKEITKYYHNEGINICVANLHGNSVFLKKFGSPKVYMKAKKSDQNVLRHKYPLTEKKLLKHKGTLILEDLSKYGIDYWVDTIFYHKGNKVNYDNFFSDNSQFILVKNKKRVFGTPKFEKNYIEKLSTNLKNKKSIFLLHPQKY
jgi:hypothetical protein